MDAIQLTGDNELHQRAKNHRKAQIKGQFTIQEINAYNYQGETPLITAVKRRATTVVKQLIEWQADTNMQDSQGNTALHFAIQELEYNIVDILCNAGANSTIFNKKGESSIHLAAQLANPKILTTIMQTSVLAKFNLDTPDAEGNTPLLIAVNNQKTKTAAWLAKAAANRLVTDKDGNMPLHRATLLGNSILVQTVIHTVALGHRNNEGDTPIMLAVKTGNGEIFESLLLSTSQMAPLDRHGNTLLHLACIPESGIILSFILRGKMVPIEEKNAEGSTALHLACKQNNISAAKCLALYGACFNVDDKLGQTPLMAAVANGNNQIMEFLLRYPAGSAMRTINTQDFSGTTALHLCAIFNKIEMARLLVAFGADTKIKNQNGQTAADIIWSNSTQQLDQYPDILSILDVPVLGKTENVDSQADPM